MARVLVAAQTLPGSYPALPLTTAGLISEQAADSTLYQYTPLIAGAIWPSSSESAFAFAIAS